VLVTSHGFCFHPKGLKPWKCPTAACLPIQRVVTGHDENGRAIFKSEDITPPK
jgi:hypothetical protein